MHQISAASWRRFIIAGATFAALGQPIAVANELSVEVQVINLSLANIIYASKADVSNFYCHIRSAFAESFKDSPVANNGDVSLPIPKH